MSIAPKKMTIGLGLGLLGGILSMAALAYSWNDTLQIATAVGINLLMATMFFATAGAFSRTAPIAGKTVTVIAAVCVGAVILSIAFGSTLLWLQIVLLIIGAVNIAIAACPEVIRFSDSRVTA